MMNVASMTQTQAQEWNKAFDAEHKNASEFYLSATLGTLREARAQYRLTLLSNPDNPYALGALVAVTELISTHTDAH